MSLAAQKGLVKNYYSVRDDMSDWAFSRLKKSIPFTPNVALKKGPVRKLKKDYALFTPYIQLNNPCFVSWIIVDVDCSVESMKMASPYYFIDRSLPVPNMKILNRESGRCQLLWAIDNVAVHSNANQAPIRYLKSTIKALTMSIKGSDREFAHDLSQNPISDRWDLKEFHEDTYSLGEIYEQLPDRSKKLANSIEYGSKKEQELTSLYEGGRNIGVFNYLRFFSYKHIREAIETTDYFSWHRFILEHANELNDQYCIPRMNTNEIEGIAKSVAHGTWYKGYGQSRVKIMEFDEDISTHERQVQAGKYSAQKKKGKTLEKLTEASNKMIEAGELLVKARLARLAQVSEKTVYRHIDFIKSIFAKANEGVSLAKVETLTNGSIQVLAPVKALPSFKYFAVSFDGHISYKSDYYSSPSSIGSQVSVFEDLRNKTISLYDSDGTFLTQHSLGSSNYLFYTHKEDLTYVDYFSPLNRLTILTRANKIDSRLVSIIKFKFNSSAYPQQSYRGCVSLLEAFDDLSTETSKKVLSLAMMRHGLNLTAKDVLMCIDL